MKLYNVLHSRLAILAVIFASICFCLVLNNPVGASTQLKGLTLSPLRTELDIAPGTSLDGVLTVTNNSTKPMSVAMSAEVFSVINQQYDYAFTAESNVVQWVSFDHTEISLQPGKSQDVKYMVGVPLSAEPGGRYISLFASTNTSDPTNSGIQSRQRVASLLYITVLGDVSRVGHLVSLTSPWLIGGDSIWSVALQNTGSTHYRSRYSLQIKDLILGSTAAGMSGEALILPGTVRLVTDSLPAPFWPGFYKAVYNIGLGDNPAVTKINLILYMPIWAVIIVIIAIAVLIYWLNRKKFWKKFSWFAVRPYK